MEQNLGKLILLKNDFRKHLENKNFQEAENVLKLMDNEYKRIGKKSIKDVLDSTQIKKIEECFNKNIDDLLKEKDFEIESK